MDIRVMEYYLAVVREGNISAAAQALHVSQPALSRQMRDLEEELGVTLFERGSRRIHLTEEGMILRRRAEEMTRLMQITEGEISQAHRNLSGRTMGSTTIDIAVVFPSSRWDITHLVAQAVRMNRQSVWP